MKHISFYFFLYGFCIATHITASDPNSAPTKACPYPEHGLTWRIVSKSNIIQATIVRNKESDNVWTSACNTLAQYTVPHVNAPVRLESDAQNAILSIQRTSRITDAQWAALLESVVEYCNKHVPESERIIDLNYYVDEGV